MEAARTGGTALTEAAARALFKVMAYKDEYEVARLYSETDFRQRVAEQFEGPYELRFHLAPPLLADRDPATGHLKKRVYGKWMLTAFGLLAKLRGLRGTPFDIFGRTAERRAERRADRRIRGGARRDRAAPVAGEPGRWRSSWRGCRSRSAASATSRKPT